MVQTSEDDTRHMAIVEGLSPGEVVLVPPGTEAPVLEVGAVLAGAE